MNETPEPILEVFEIKIVVAGLRYINEQGVAY